MRQRLLLLVLTMICAALLPATAATFDVAEAGDGLRIVLLEGDITPDDPARFGRAIMGAEKVVVAFDSPGGNLLAGIQLGRVIRLRGYRTMVPSGARCASACALAWLAGTSRYMQADALIGFHAAYDSRDMQVSGVGNALAGHYLAEIGLPSRAVVYISQASPREITWLSPVQAQANGIEVTILASTAAATGSRPSLPQPPPARPAPPITLAEAARDFVRRMYAATSDDNDSALRFIAGAYASQVTFYGSPQSTEYIINLKRQFIERWPLRVYLPRMDSVQINCNNIQRTCSVAGFVDWDARSPARAAVSTGLSSFSLELMIPANGEPYITAENGRVLSRQTSRRRLSAPDYPPHALRQPSCR